MTQVTDRQRLIRLIHVAKRELGLDDATYRTMLLAHGKNDSTSTMDAAALHRVVEHLKRSGFKVRSKTPAGASRRPLADDPQSRKVRALWLFLHQVGEVKNPSETALASYVKRITHADDLKFVSSAQAYRLIETLKKWATRVLPGKVKEAHSLLADAVRNRDLDIDTDQLSDVIRMLREAEERSTFDPLHQAWQAACSLLHQAYPDDQRFKGVGQP